MKNFRILILNKPCGMFCPLSRPRRIRLSGKRPSSQGIRIPKLILEQSGLRGEVELTVEGGQIVVSVSDRTATAPGAFGLAQNYPNPFNGETAIFFTLTKQTGVRLRCSLTAEKGQLSWPKDRMAPAATR